MKLRKEDIYYDDCEEVIPLYLLREVVKELNYRIKLKDYIVDWADVDDLFGEVLE